MTIVHNSLKLGFDGEGGKHAYFSNLLLISYGDISKAL